MRALFSTYGSRRDVEPMVGPVVRLGTLGAAAGMCAPPDFAAVEEGECDAPVATGVMPTGGWR